MVQRPRPDLRGGCAAMRIPTVTGVKQRVHVLGDLGSARGRDRAGYQLWNLVLSVPSSTRVRV